MTEDSMTEQEQELTDDEANALRLSRYCGMAITPRDTTALARYDARKAREASQDARGPLKSNAGRRGWVAGEDRVYDRGTWIRAEGGAWSSTGPTFVTPRAEVWTGCPHCERPDPHEASGCERGIKCAEAPTTLGDPIPDIYKHKPGLPPMVYQEPNRPRTDRELADALARALFNRKLRAEAYRVADGSIWTVDGVDMRLNYEGKPTVIRHGHVDASRSEASVTHALDVMWTRTKTDVRAECEREAEELVWEMSRK